MRADLPSSTAAETTPDHDPHLCEAWFDLLRRTAISAAATVELVPVGAADAPQAARLPLLREPADAARVTALSTFYTPIFAPLGVERVEQAALTRCFEELRARPGVAELRLAPLDPQAPFFAMARQSLREAGWLVDDYFCFGNWHAELGDGGFDAYWAKRPSMLRHTAERARKKLAAAPGFAIAVCDGGAELETAIADFVLVYAHSWKQPEPWPRFIPELCRLAAARGWLRLGVLRLDGQAVASQLWLVCGDTAQIVKLAHDRAYDERSVGTVLTAHMMAHVIDRDRVRHLDFLIGDDAYKRDWTPLRRERWGIVAFNPRHLRGLAGAALHFAAHAAKRLLKR
ncbi:MAG: GNAT family N-acetyltransferase [Azoarcus sp.]|jgi:hypothetical protein|nr:GNAT family N-acetyltransferase [Azoarcus sp.]